MSSQPPRSATALYATAATSAVIGGLLWLRGHNGAAPRFYTYGSQPDLDSYPPSGWRVWSSAMPEERLGMYLLGGALVLALAARVIATRRE